MFDHENVQALVRRTHEQQVLAALRRRGPLSRAQLVRMVGISRTTVSEITSDLIASGAVIVSATDAETRVGSGRRAQLLQLDSRAGQYVGVDLAHRHVRVVVAGAAQGTLAAAAADYRSQSWPERVTEAIRLVDETAERHGLHYGALQAVAIGVMGTDRHLRRLAGEAFGDRFACPVVVDNNTRFAALAEALAEGPRVRDLLYLRLADGVGGGVVIGGRLVPGGLGNAGEFGHVRVEDGRAARPCRCGGRGCLETVASVPAVLDRAGLGAGPGAGRTGALEQLAAAYADGDPAARAAVDRAAAATGRVLGMTTLVLSPERIVIGGPLPRLMPGLVPGIASALADEVGVGALPDVRGARLDDEDGARGAVAMLRERSPLVAEYAGPREDAHV
ncbi:MAG: ROK family transcriptional regulator [Nocardioides sp.]|uniref:ROK family transcriptional regulator n=1 Tax=Nocardioides sp. TaxID=35761 RepID=UPI0039E611EB